MHKRADITINIVTDSDPVLATVIKKETNPNRQVITEEMGVHKEWYVQAKEQSRETLPEFLDHLMNDYEHDYGTICHAIAAGAIATAVVINRGPQGGITGYQSGAVMWEFIRNWQYMDGPLRLIEFSEMLYPQNADQFDKVVSKSTWAELQKMAKEKLILPDCMLSAHPDVIAHWKSIVDGVVPFGWKVGNE